MRNNVLENQSKFYKAYTGIGELVVLLPWTLPTLILVAVYINEVTSGDPNRIALFLALIANLVTLIPVGIVGGMSMWTSLSLCPDGIEYQHLVLEQHPSCWLPFRVQIGKLRVEWDDIHDVTRVQNANGAIVIKTKLGDIKFWVMFRPDVNEEIVQEILRRAPQIKMLN